jgi:hypothetical protein
MPRLVKLGIAFFAFIALALAQESYEMPENGLRDLEQVSRICVTNDAGFVLH